MIRAVRWRPKNKPGRSREITKLQRRVVELEAAVEENRQLNQRLADVIDVVTEVLVPVADRDDARMKAALERLNGTLS